MTITETQKTAQLAADAAVSAAEAKQYMLEAEQGYQDTSAAAQQAQDAAGSALLSKQSAATSEENSLQYATEAGVARDEAVASASTAAEFGDNKLTFADTTAGIAGTTSGQYFRVSQGVGNVLAFRYYKNNAGVAVEVAEYVGQGSISNSIREYSSLTAAQSDISAGNILSGGYCWVRNTVDTTLADEYINNSGTLEATGRKMPSQQGVIEEIDSRLVPGPYSAKKFPLWHDENENVPIWLDKGLLDAAGVGPVLRDYIKNFMNDTSGPISSADKYFINGDLFKFIFKRGRVFNGDAVSLNIAFTGDSWTEISTIPKSLINVLGGVYKDPGWISCSTQSDTFMSGISLVATNFTKYDGGNRTVNPPPYGSGPDGNAYYNNNAVGTLTWSGVTATDLLLFYYDGSGAFTITIDGGTPVTVTGANTGTAKKYDITGLTATAHTVTIQSLGVGVVSVFGMYGKNNSIRSGITVSRIGNGGAIASDYLNWSQWIPQTVQNIDVDLLFIILGTNDFRLSFGLDQYISGISEIITKYKTATPGICICLVSPAQSNATGTPALSEYDTAMRKLALDNNLNFISGYELFPKTYDNSNGAWNDSLHLSTRGAYVLTRIMKDNFIKD